MWIGRHQLGVHLDILFQTVDSDGVPTLPSAVPTIQIRRSSDNAVVYSGLMPIDDKTVSPGMFRLPLFLGSGFSVGNHSLRLATVVDSSPVLEVRSFDIIPGGSQRGQVLGMAYFHRPEKDQVAFQVESGRILAGSNPRIR